MVPGLLTLVIIRLSFKRSLEMRNPDLLIKINSHIRIYFSSSLCNFFFLIEHKYSHSQIPTALLPPFPPQQPSPCPYFLGPVLPGPLRKVERIKMVAILDSQGMNGHFGSNSMGEAKYPSGIARADPVS